MWPIINQSYWRDEAFSVLLSGRPLKDLFSLIVRFDHAPPLFTYWQHFWISLFGPGEVEVRLLSFIFHALTAFFVYKISQSKLAALAAGLNPFLWHYAWEARQYSAYAAVVLAAVYFYSVKKIRLANVFWGLSLVTHNFSWLYFGSFLFLTRDRRLLAALIPGLIWLPWLWQQVSRVGQGMWLGQLSGMWWWQSLKIFLVSDSVYKVKPPLLFFSLVLLVLGLRKLNRLLLLAFLPPLLTVIISKIWEPLYLERYLLPSLPLLIAGAVLNLKKINFVKYSGVIYLVLAAFAIVQISRRESNPPMRQAAAKIAGQIRSGEIIVTEQPINYLEVYFYLQKSGNEDRLYSYLYPGESEIPYYVGTDLIKPWQEIVDVPEHRPGWLVKPDGSVVKY